MGEDSSYTVPGIALSECPRCVITPESEHLVEIACESRMAKEAYGAIPFGQDLNKWPARLAEAFLAIEQERILEHNARQAAIAESQR